MKTNEQQNSALKNDVIEPKNPRRKSLLWVVAFLVMWFGGCYYIGEKSGVFDEPDYKGMKAHNKATHEGQKQCSWCGGIGNVGYAGASKAQVERTGNGLGNICTSCKGTGYVDKD